VNDPFTSSDARNESFKTFELPPQRSGGAISPS
jgi:hypothetical protein